MRRKSARAYARCIAAVRRLAAAGHELRRPTADYLEDGIYELRVHEGWVQYRILYSFQGLEVAVLLHASTKEGRGEQPMLVRVALPSHPPPAGAVVSPERRQAERHELPSTASSTGTKT